jgi:hypothetical protein
VTNSHIYDPLPSIYSRAIGGPRTVGCSHPDQPEPSITTLNPYLSVCLNFYLDPESLDLTRTLDLQLASDSSVESLPPRM